MTVVSRGPAMQSLLRYVPSITSAAVVIVASLVLLGWSFHVEPLKTVLPASVIIIPNTGMLSLLAGASLWIQTRSARGGRHRWIGLALAGVVFVFAAAFFAERISGWDLGVNLLLFPDAIQKYSYRPAGLMAVNTALAFMLASSALLLLDFRARAHGPRPSELLAATAFCIVFVALVGYAYDVKALYTFDQYAGMALLTALILATLSIGTLVARPEGGLASLFIGDDAGAGLALSLLPAGVIVPVGLGWLWLAGRRAQLFTAETGVSFFVVLTVVVYGVLVLRSAGVARATDRAREFARGEAERARLAAESANRAKSEFLAAMSHELRTPLNAIRGYTDLIDMGLRGPVTEEQRADLARIRYSERHLLGLIDDVLNFARLETGHLEYAIDNVGVDHAVTAVWPLISPQLAAKNISFESMASGSPLAMRADPDKLQQILLNLLSNALKYTASGGSVRVTADAEGEAVRIHVTDTGRGVPEHRLAEIFEPFVQVDSRLTRTASGVGLGLAISRTLARAMRGDVTVVSEVDRGSTFTVSLPRATPNAPAEWHAEPFISN